MQIPHDFYWIQRLKTIVSVMLLRAVQLLCYRLSFYYESHRIRLKQTETFSQNPTYFFTTVNPAQFYCGIKPKKFVLCMISKNFSLGCSVVVSCKGKPDKSHKSMVAFFFFFFNLINEMARKGMFPHFLGSPELPNGKYIYFTNMKVTWVCITWAQGAGKRSRDKLSATTLASFCYDFHTKTGLISISSKSYLVHSLSWKEQLIV